jgi:hypothetical protein
MKRVARVRREQITSLPKARHYAGQPPPDQKRSLLPIADVLVLLLPDGRKPGVFLARFTKDRKFAGDTWHANQAEAEEQALFEFGSDLGEWHDVPPDIGEEVGFALDHY